jgi:hypothetical protein
MVVGLAGDDGAGNDTVNWTANQMAGGMENNR